ncbi:Hypothetical protein A7982_11660 [Minicystis rosea]|nr:Hypothetical protein A7982_11660 [Minicystis rosea]
MRRGSKCSCRPAGSSRLEIISRDHLRFSTRRVHRFCKFPPSILIMTMDGH